MKKGHIFYRQLKKGKKSRNNKIYRTLDNLAKKGGKYTIKRDFF
jgi:hypothetical protein